ncbi:transcriptional regulator [Streptomyces sp. NPDC002867]
MNAQHQDGGGQDLVDAPHHSTSQQAADIQAALDELRRQLEAAREAKDRTKDWLEARTGLSHGTVSAAFSMTARAPSKRTVRLLANALGLDPAPLVKLLVTAEKHKTSAGQVAAPDRRRSQSVQDDGRCRPVRSWTAKRLGVHRAISGNTIGKPGAEFILPTYVPRSHDHELRQLLTTAVNAEEPLLVLVRGESCTGKTRTAYEAVRTSVPDNFNLVFPTDARDLLEILRAEAVQPCTVLWLNEAQTHLSGEYGEAAAAALLRRLDGAGPLLVIATLWPTHDKALTSNQPANCSEPDAHPNARALLVQASRIYLPKSFAGSLDAVRSAASGDPSLAAVVALGTPDITQTLAAGPDLVEHYEHPVGEHGIYGQALISAAMDAHRLSATSPLPLDFLEHAAPGYLSEAERAAADPDAWFKGALAYARAPIKGITSALQSVPPSSGMGAQRSVIGLADYLQQHGHLTRWALCPPATFWASAARHLPGHADLTKLANAAQARHRYRHAAILYCTAADSDAGAIDTLRTMARLRKAAGDLKGAERLYQAAAATGSPIALEELAALRAKAGDLEGAERFARQAANAGDLYQLSRVAQAWEQAGDRGRAERLARQAANAGDGFALHILAGLRETAGDLEGAERLYQDAAYAGNRSALHILTGLRETAGDLEGAERFARQAADAGDASQLVRLADRHAQAAWDRAFQAAADANDVTAMESLLVVRHRADDTTALSVAVKQAGPSPDSEAAEHLYRAAAFAGDAMALRRLVELRESASDWEGAEQLARQVAATGSIEALSILAVQRERAGDRDGAEQLARQAADRGDTRGLREVTALRESSGDRDGAERLARQAADAGITSVLGELAALREGAGDRAGAERLYQDAADAGNRSALRELAKFREEAGDQEGAERLARQATDAGYTRALAELTLLREQAGDQEGAERLARQIADAGNTRVLREVATLREGNGNPAGAERLHQYAADAGDTIALQNLAQAREQAGDQEGAERLARRAAETGDTMGWRRLLRLRKEARDRDGVERLARQAADAGDTAALRYLAELYDEATAKRLLRYGLEADGTPAQPWPWPEPQAVI